jgi:hypothetical protein
MIAINRRRLIEAGLVATLAQTAPLSRRPLAMTNPTNPMLEAPMLEALHAGAANEALAPKLRLYGQFVGSWDLDVEWHAPTGNTVRAAGEWHFSWVLEGRAVQDVWIFPSRRARAAPPQPPGSLAWAFYGSTFRWVRAGDRRLAHPLFRADAAVRDAPARPRGRRRHRADRRGPQRHPPPLALRRDRRARVPLARRCVVGPRRELDARARDARAAGVARCWGSAARLLRRRHDRVADGDRAAADDAGVDAHGGVAEALLQGERQVEVALGGLGIDVGRGTARDRL